MIDAMLTAAVAGNPDGAAIVFGDRELRYRELHALIAGFGQGLRDRGVGPGDHVMIVLPNCPEFATSYFATARIGATVQAVDPGTADHELLRLVEQTAPAAVVTTPRHAARLGEACVVVVVGDTVDEVVAAPAPADDVAGGPWVTVSSSGSTGAAKHLGRSQANQVAEADNIAASARITRRDVILCPVPLFHALGQFCCLVTAARAGATLVLLDHDSGQPIVEQVVEAVERHRVTILIGVPYLFEALSDLPADRRVDFSSVRLCLSGSNFLPAAVPGRFQARFGVPLRQTYGSTEAGSVSWDVDPYPTPASVGQPLSGVTVRILDDDGRLLPANAVGEIAVQGAAVITDGFYRTGDLGRLDDEGRLYVIGRTRLQIDTGGRKVNPIEVEDILRQHPSTSDAAVVGLPLRGGGELLAAAVVTASQEPEPLLAHCRARLAPYQVPQRIHFVREIPRSPTGKVRRAHLSDLLAAADDGDPGLLARLPALPPERRTTELAGYLATRVADILCAAKENLDPRATLPALGIDSLGALRLRMAVQDDLRLSLELPELLGRSSITSVAERLAGRLNDAGTAAVVTRGRTAGEFPLSANQRSLWHAEQMNPDNGVYVLAFAARITSGCDSAALQRAFQLLVDRHPVLRTTFPVRDGVPVQRVAEHATVDFRVVDRDEAALDEEAFRAFDIAAAPALRVRLFVGDARGPVLLVAQHHIITDYWSLVVLLRELAAGYTAESLGRELYLPAPSHSYTDYGRWLDEAADLDYWLTQLQPPPPAADLPTDRERPVVRRQRGATFRQELPETCVAALRAYARSRGTTVYSVLLAAFHVWLHAYTGNDDSAVAVNTANRDRPEFADVLGYFANPIVHRVRVEADEPFAALVDRVSATLLAGLDHQLVTFEQVIGSTGAHRDRGRAPLVEVCFGQNKAQDAGLAGLGAFLSAGGDGHRLRLGTLVCESIALGKPGVVYDFAGAVYESDDAVAIVWEYDRDLFEHATVRRMTDGFATVLDVVSAAPDTLVRDIAVADVAMLLDASRGVPLPDGLPAVTESIGRHAAEDPEAPAVEDGAVVLTRGELEARADAIAAAVGEGDGPVAVWVSSTADLAAAGLGVLRAGACCAALDSGPDLAGTRLLITTAARRESLGTLPIPVIDVEQPRTGGRPPTPRLDAPALVLRTAGVEGPPRTVVLDHRALSAAAHRGTGGDVLLFDSHSAGRTLATLLTVLACGGTAVSDGAFAAAVGSGRAWGSVAMTPTELARVLDHLDRTGGTPRVGTLVLSGEVLPARLVDRWREHAAGTRIVHEYGGAGFCVSAGDVPPEVTGVVPVGRPVPGTHRYVLDGAGRLCPVGVPGEIRVAGDRTGDIGRYLPNGDLVVLGRAAAFGREHGYRGDPTRVEEALHAIPAVRFAVVAGTTAFVEPTGLDVAQLRAALRRTVPHHLVPEHIVLTDRVPTAGDGKSARFGVSATTDQAEPTPEPATAVETALAAIWAEVLGLDHVGLDDDYYALGGDSVMTIRIATKAAEHGIRLTRRQLFTHPTVRALATVARTDAAPTTLRRSLSRHRTIPLTPIQHWFFDQRLPVIGHWNQTVVLTTDDPAHLRAAMTAVAEHHSAFRFRYRRRADGWDQVLDPTGDAVGMASGPELADVVADAHAGIDIETGPMLRMAIAGSTVVLAAHHLVMDFLSWGIVLDDLARAYRQLRDGEPVRLPPASTPYDVWARKLAEYADSPELRGQLPYWTTRTGPPPATEPSREGQARSTHRRLSRDETRALLGTRTPRLVLAAVVRAVARDTGESTVWVDLEGHGREDLFDNVDLTRTVGWFTALHPVAFSVGPSPLRTLTEVHAALDRIPGNGLGYGLLRYSASDPAVRERMAAVPRPAVSFNYLGRLGWLLGDRDGTGLFRPVPAPEGHDRAPGNPRPYRWEFSASVAGEVMTVTLSHAGDPTQAERLLDDVCATLRTLSEGHE